jgi:hypothetical protein
MSVDRTLGDINEALKSIERLSNSLNQAVVQIMARANGTLQNFDNQFNQVSHCVRNVLSPNIDVS